MFDQTLDIEQAFGQSHVMNRTHVRRRRMVATLVGVAVAAVLSGPVAGAVGRPALEPVSRRTYVVKAGDTLWGIVAKMAPGQDPRPWVQRIEAANPGLDVGALRPGQTLAVPSR
jgi:Tfp pilus assembly protein FimV